MNLKLVSLLIGFFFLVHTMSSCATLARGTKEPLHFTSIPDNATVKLSNGLMCETTPCSIEVPRKSKFIATFSKNGCVDKMTNVENTASNGVWMLFGNVMVSGVAVMLVDLFSDEYFNNSLQVFPGLVGFGIDLYTGASRDIFPNPVEVTLEC